MAQVSLLNKLSNDHTSLLYKHGPHINRDILTLVRPYLRKLSLLVCGGYARECDLEPYKTPSILELDITCTDPLGPERWKRHITKSFVPQEGHRTHLYPSGKLLVIDSHGDSWNGTHIRIISPPYNLQPKESQRLKFGAIDYACTGTNDVVFVGGGWRTDRSMYVTDMLCSKDLSSPWVTVHMPYSVSSHCFCMERIRTSFISVGGTSHGRDLLSTFRFDGWRGDSWSSFGDLPIPIVDGAMELCDGVPIIVGGYNHNIAGKRVNNHDVYGYTQDRWTKLSNLPLWNWGNNIVSFDGKILVMGGGIKRSNGSSVPKGSIRKECQVYDMRANSWCVEDKWNLPFPMIGHTVSFIEYKR